MNGEQEEGNEIFYGISSFGIQNRKTLYSR